MSYSKTLSRQVDGGSRWIHPGRGGLVKLSTRQRGWETGAVAAFSLLDGLTVYTSRCCTHVHDVLADLSMQRWTC